MSYILDALKRADSEREREREDVPGLHSKTDTWVAPDEVRKGRSRQPQALIWSLAAVGLMIVLGLLWFLLTREVAPAAVLSATASTPAPTPVQAAPVQTAPVTVQQAPPPPVIAPAPAAAPAPTPAPTPAARAQPTPPARPARVVQPAAVVVPEQAALQTPAQASPPPSPPPVSAKPKAQVAAAPAPSPPAPTASAATSPEARLYTLSELPEDVRAGLPVLTVGGAMYSQTPANRMLIINGQVVREGDTIAPGLVLEQIKLKSAVLKVKGLRYGISY
jgi:general secretion pathway protein B